MAFEIFRRQPEHRPFAELEDFLNRLDISSDKSPARRAYASTYIEKHQDDLKKALIRIQEDPELGGFTRARKLRKLLEEFKEGPAGYDFDLKTATLRSFRPAPKNTPSFTIPADYPLLKRAGYLFAAGMMAGMIWSGVKIVNLTKEYIGVWVERQEQAVNLNVIYK